MDDDAWIGTMAPSKELILRTRSLFGALAGRTSDPERARRIEAELNDAWLRLQFALVTNNPVLERVERRTCAALLDEARQAMPQSTPTSRRAA